jgi:hypothetical protein
LKQVFGLAVYIRAQIQHVRMAFERRDAGNDGRAVDACQGFEHEAGHGHQRARIACANTGLRNP